MSKKKNSNMIYRNEHTEISGDDPNLDKYIGRQQGFDMLMRALEFIVSIAIIIATIHYDNPYILLLFAGKGIKYLLPALKKE